MPNPPRAKRASVLGPRAQAACDRACNGYARVCDLADKLSDDIDQLTMPGTPVEISEEDSIVTTLESIVDSPRAVAGGG